MTAQTIKAVGMIGLGNMGSALADALIAKGFPVTVWNRTPARAARFAAAGTNVAASVADAARGSDVLVVCLLDHAATMSALAPAGVADGLKGKKLVQLTTMTSEESGQIQGWAAVRGIDYLEGQILNYPDDIRSGRGIIACAGPKPIFEKCRTVVQAMAGYAPHIAEVIGAAAVLDKALFEVLFLPLVGFLHGAAMCRAMGISIETYTEIVLAAYFRSKLIEHEIAKMARRVEAGDYERDVQTALDTYSPVFSKTLRESEALGMETEHLKGVDQVLRRACTAGHGSHDFAAVYELFRIREGAKG